MNAGKGRRCAALLLCLAMMFSMVGAASPAADEAPSEGLCEHHTEHTEECGYIAPSEGSPCLHVHDESCGYAEPAPETPCDKGCADADGDGVVDHAAGCAYTPAEAGSPCRHVHDESCGYAAASEGAPCQYKCEICGAAASTPGPEPTDDGNTHTIPRPIPSLPPLPQIPRPPRAERTPPAPRATSCSPRATPAWTSPPRTAASCPRRSTCQP